MRGVLSMRGRVGALTTVLALGVIASGALAGAKLTTSSDSDIADGQTYAAATAKCKPGAKAISGGFAMDDYVFDVAQSFRTGARTWKVQAYNFTGDLQTLTTFAYCRDENLKSREATETIAIGASGTVKAKCGEGERAVSGGFDGELLSNPSGGDGPYIQPGTSRKAGPRGWKVRAGNFGDDDATLSAQVNCREGRALATRKKSGTVGDDPFAITAKCKRSQRVVSGGFSGPDLVGSNYLVPLVSKKAGKRGWRLGGEADGEVTVYAYCEKKG
jgi:hypothetical protein